MKMSLFDIITVPLGFIINMIYRLVQNYGVAIIIFTIIVKLILLPLNIKSQKAMRKQQKIQPILAELQKKYANDKEKLQQEMMKLYKDNNVSMMGGCLPMLIQMPILIGLYNVIRSPLRYLFGVSIADAGVVDKINLIIQRMTEQFPAEISKYTGYTAQRLFDIAQIELSTWSEKVLDIAEAWSINYNFLGLDLSKYPSASLSAITSANFSDWATIALLIIPALAVFTTWISMKQSQKMSGQNNNSQNEQMASTMNTMNLMMPIMTGFFAFTLPSGMGIYWIISNLVQMIQQHVLNAYFKDKEDDFVVKVREPNRKNRKKHR